MIIQDKTALQGTPRDAAGPGWTSLRLLVRSDGMGFSMTETQVLPGAALKLHYKNHVEACYCIAGQGTVVEQATGARHAIKPGVLNAHTPHDVHELHETPRADALQLHSVISPALEGDEVHGPDGSYAAPDPD